MAAGLALVAEPVRLSDDRVECFLKSGSGAMQPTDVEWFANAASDALRHAERRMADGTVVYAPQGTAKYKAFWLRDYEMMLEAGIVPTNRIVPCAKIFLNALSPKGEGVDCVKFDGTPIYKPGYGKMGENAVLDGGPYTVLVAYHTWRRSADGWFLSGEVLGRLAKALAAIPHDRENGLPWIDPSKAWDRCPWGFTDTVRKTGCCLFSSLLEIAARRGYAEMLAASGDIRRAEAERAEAARLVAAVNRVFWDEDAGLYRAATVRCREHDVMGSAYAVWLGVSGERRTRRIADVFRDRLDDFVSEGQVRHLPKGVYWECDGGTRRDAYQNGAYWGTASGWYAWALAHVDRSRAIRLLGELRTAYEKYGAVEWSFGKTRECPEYLSSLALPLQALRRFEKATSDEAIIVRGESAAPVSVATNMAGNLVFDFGRHVFGWVELNVRAKGPYRLVWGELLDGDGSVQTNDFYTVKEGRIRYVGTEGAFDATGWRRVPVRRGEGAFNPDPVGSFGIITPFRWLEVVRAPFPLAVEDVRQVPIHYPYDMDEELFACDSSALVKVHDFCKHSIRATTYTGKFIDGDRERLPYEADSFITQLGTYAMTSDQTLVRKMVDYLATHTTWPTEWKQFFIRMVYEDWMRSGKTDLVERHYELMKTVKSWRHLRRADGLLVTRGPTVTPAPDGEEPHDIVDWAMCYRDGFVFTGVNAVVNALHYRNLRELAEMARAIGREDDARTFAEEADLTYASFQKAFYDSVAGRYRDGEGTDHATVQGNAMALACGAVPPECVRSVAGYVASKGLSCSTYMAQFVLEALFAGGRADAAIGLMTSSAHRSWLGMMAQGATITPEFWDLTMPEKGRIPDMNHAWSTAPLNVISRFVLGVTALEPGFAKAAVRPMPGPLKRLSGKVPTVRGTLGLKMELEGSFWRIVLEAPMPVVFAFGDCRKELSAGKHDFTVEVREKML